MKYVIVLVLSLCHLITKAHDPAVAAKGCRLVSYMHFDGKSKDDVVIHADAPGNQDAIIMDIDDDDNDFESACKHSLFVKTIILQFYLQLFSAGKNIDRGQICYSRHLIISTDKYITQRVLRI